MFDLKVSNRPERNTLASPKKPTEVTAISAPGQSQDQIRERAYQLYESRGRQDGEAQQDWLTAQQQISNEHS